MCTDCLSLAYFSAQCELILNYNFILLLTNVLNSFQTVCEEKQTVHVADIEKDKITEFCVGDRILHINGKHMSTVQNVMDIIGVVKTGEVIQFDVERSYEFQPNHCKNTHSLTLKKTRKKKQYNEKET